MKLRTLIFTILLIVIRNFLFAQQSIYSKVFFNQTIPTQAYSFVKTAENNFIIAGMGNNSPFYLKIDSLGNVIWNKLIGENGIFNQIISYNDSTYFLIGNTFNQFSNSSDMFCIKINSNGDTLWTKSINFIGEDIANSSIKLSTGNIIIVGNSNIGNQTNINISMMDTEGNIKFCKIISTPLYKSSANEIIESSDGNIYIFGDVIRTTTYEQNPLLIKLDSLGNILFSKKYGPTQFQGISFCLKSDTIYSYSYSNYYEALIMKLDLTGNILNSNTYEINEIYNFFNTKSFQKIRNINNTLFLQTTQNIYKLDSSLNIINNNYISYIVEPLTDFVLLEHKNYMLIGNGPMWITDKYQNISIPQIALIKTDSLGYSSQCYNYYPITPTLLNISMISTPISFSSENLGNETTNSYNISTIDIDYYDGCVGYSGNLSHNNLSDDIYFYPKPANKYAKLNSYKNNSFKFQNLSIFNELGIEIEIINEDIDNNFILNTSYFTSGLYFVQLQSDNNILTKKLLIRH